jgi:hypothetical protein
MGDGSHVVSADLRRLCEALGLRYEPQDWGIVNADGNRLVEFVRFYESHPELSAAQKFELGELILASANDVLCTKGTLDQRLLEFLATSRGSFEAHMEYWRGLEDVKEFPIAEWLRASF